MSATFNDPGNIVAGAAVTINRTSFGSGASALAMRSTTPPNGGHFLQLFLASTPNPVLYINDGAHWFMRTALVVSGHWTGAYPNSYNISMPNPTGGMISAWSDAPGPVFVARGNVGADGERNFDGMDHAGNFTFSIENSGALSFGAGTRAGQDVKFKRMGAGILGVRNAADSAFGSIQGKLTTEANAATETIVPDKTITLYDAAGTAYKVPCVAA